MTWSLDIVLLMILAVAALWAVMATRLIYAALGLAFASIVLAVVMFRLGSPYAAVIELSVCAGLITAIFISVISLAKHESISEIEARMKRRWKKYAPLPVAAAVLGIVLATLARHPRSLPAPLAETDVRKVFWHFRQVDLLGQIIIVLVGALGIVVLFKSWRKK
jgi:NADH-quinone oxidoreductase subunit J